MWGGWAVLVEVWHVRYADATTESVTVTLLTEAEGLLLNGADHAVFSSAALGLPKAEVRAWGRVEGTRVVGYLFVECVRTWVCSSLVALLWVWCCYVAITLSRYMCPQVQEVYDTLKIMGQKDARQVPETVFALAAYIYKLPITVVCGHLGVNRMFSLTAVAYGLKTASMGKGPSIYNDGGGHYLIIIPRGDMDFVHVASTRAEAKGNLGGNVRMPGAVIPPEWVPNVVDLAVQSGAAGECLVFCVSWSGGGVGGVGGTPGIMVLWRGAVGGLVKHRCFGHILCLSTAVADFLRVIREESTSARAAVAAAVVLASASGGCVVTGGGILAGGEAGYGMQVVCACFFMRCDGLVLCARCGRCRWWLGVSGITRHLGAAAVPKYGNMK